MALENKTREELQRMEDQSVITKVTEPTEWSSHMVDVVQRDKVRVCVDPTSFNQAIFRENYPMSTLDKVATRLFGAILFSTLDAASWFW